MNVAYFIYHGVYYENDMFDVCIRSLKKQSDCEIYVYTPNLDNQELLKDRGVNVVEFPMSDWEDRRMTCKVEKVKDLMSKLDTGDNIMCFDSDLIFLKNPFDVFDNDFDFMYTTRHYSYEYKANGGVWGIKVNEKSNQFMEHYISNLNNPSWEPYVNFRKNHTYNRDLNNLDWWVDQDWLCVCNDLKEQINNGALGIPLTIFDATSKYNFIITKGQKEIGHQIELDENYILHLKGGVFGRWETQGTVENIEKNKLQYETFFKNLLD